MGLFGWLASHWTPAYEYRDYYANEVEYITWESTTAGSRRGFLLGVPTGALVTVAVLGGAVMTGLYTPPAPTVASREGPRETAASHATNEDLDTLRKENQTLKKQLGGAAVAAVCPPCRPQAITKGSPPSQTVAAPPSPSKQKMPTTAAPRKARGTVPDDQVPPPIRSNCRQEGNCQ